MSATVPQSGVIPLSRAIDHYFELSLYLLVLTGFGTLASTGGLDLATVILVGSLLAVRGYFLAKRRSIVISERWTTPLTILYFIFFGEFIILFRREKLIIAKMMPFLESYVESRDSRDMPFDKERIIFFEDSFSKKSFAKNRLIINVDI